MSSRGRRGLTFPGKAEYSLMNWLAAREGVGMKMWRADAHVEPEPFGELRDELAARAQVGGQIGHELSLWYTFPYHNCAFSRASIG